MNDETRQTIEDLSTLACSTDEILRKRALVALLGRVVGRASQVDHEQGSDDFITVERDRDALVSQVERLTANVEQARQERDTHKANAETLARDLEEVRKELAKTTEERDAALERDKAVRVLTADTFQSLVATSHRAYADYPGNVFESWGAMLRWLEREGYMSVRLPPEE